MKLQWLFSIILVALTVTACGQRAPIEAPQGKVQDTRSY